MLVTLVAFAFFFSVALSRVGLPPMLGFFLTVGMQGLPNGAVFVTAVGLVQELVAMSIPSSNVYREAVMAIG
ncbi:MAG: hypothetical protein ACO35I_09810 [Burkholderiaceae bacterium]